MKRLFLLSLVALGCGAPAPESPPAEPVVSWALEARPTLIASCAGSSCHSDGASHTFVLERGCAPDLASVLDHVNLEIPEASALLVKGDGGDNHVGGNQLDSGEFDLLLIWIRDGARGGCE